MTSESEAQTLTLIYQGLDLVTSVLGLGFQVLVNIIAKTCQTGIFLIFTTDLVP